jgi:predicted metal-dependent hydrolase
VEHHDAAPRVSLDHTRLILRIREDTPLSVREAALDGWYREQVRSAATPLITKWQPIIGVQVARLFVRRMKTRWGSCNHRLRTIRLNTDLAKKPPECLEYLIVHEMVHIIEPTHNDHFRQPMARFMPNWQHHRNLLNQLPLRHEEWGY